MTQDGFGVEDFFQDQDSGFRVPGGLATLQPRNALHTTHPPGEYERDSHTLRTLKGLKRPYNPQTTQKSWGLPQNFQGPPLNRRRGKPDDMQVRTTDPAA